MSRSIKKSPFFRYNIIKNKNKWIKIYNKSFTIMPKDIDYNFDIYNGKTFIKLNVNKNMLGYKFGEFINTKKRSLYKKKK